MARVSRREEELQTRRVAVLQAAGRVFARKGFEGATIAEIAREAEVGVGTIYQLFENKDALQNALLEEKAGRLLALAGTEAGARPTEPGGVQKLAGIELLLSEARPEVWLGKRLGRREREARSKRRDILDAAGRVFIDKGFYGAAMANIAEEAGVATGTLYNFFSSKEELYFSLIEEKADEFLLYLQMEVSGGSSAVDKIARLVQAECSFFEANQAFFRIYVSTRIGFEWAIQEELGERIHDKYAVYLDWVTRIVEAGMREGVLRAMEPREMAEALVGTLNASVFGWMAAATGPGPGDGAGPSLAARAPRIVELFLNGAQRP